MGTRCGCVDDHCNCRVLPGPGIVIDGQGIDSDPYTLVPIQPAYIQTGLVGSRRFNVTGTGTGADPYVLSADLPSSTVAVPRSVFLYAEALSMEQQWVKPAGVQLVKVTCIGGGQGGQAGHGSFDGTGAGGYGGAGGGYTSRYVYLPSTTTRARIFVGAGGSGGIGQPPSFAAMDGAAGGDSYVEFLTSTFVVTDTVRAYGGPDSRGQQFGQPSSPMSTTTSASNPLFSANAGGAGGGWSGGVVAPRASGSHTLYNGTTVYADHGWHGGNGGTGGARGPSGDRGLPGANGFQYGGGGGGGGATAVTPGTRYPGNGGNGASGLVVIETL